MTEINGAVYAVGTLLIMYFSWWLSIKEKRYHGVYRFFAFESAFIMTVMNKPSWFIDPFSVLQLLSWACLCLSLAAVMYAYYLIVSWGKPQGKFENTTKLVFTGLYKLIRHPMYLSILLFGAGAYLKGATLATSGLMAVIAVAIYLTAKVEEGEMIAKFGDEYREYMKKTKMFIPYIF